MDQDRQIRILLPPFFLFASLALGAYLGGWRLSTAGGDVLKEVLPVLGAAGLSVLPLGFIIGAIARLILPIMFLPFGIRHYQAHVPPPELALIAKQLRVQQRLASKPSDSFNALVTFDHELLAKGVHTNVMRRWSAFIVSAHSCIGILLGHVVGYCLEVPQSGTWWRLSLVLCAILAVNAAVTWFETMDMLAFQAHREQNVRGGHDSESG